MMEHGGIIKKRLVQVNRGSEGRRGRPKRSKLGLCQEAYEYPVVFDETHVLWILSERDSSLSNRRDQQTCL